MSLSFYDVEQLNIAKRYSESIINMCTLQLEHCFSVNHYLCRLAYIATTDLIHLSGDI